MILYDNRDRYHLKNFKSTPEK